MLLRKYAVCHSKKSKFIKEKEARGLLSKLAVIEISILSDLPVKRFSFKSFTWVQ